MTLISTIITDAYREPNLIARGATETTAEQTEALRLLDRLIQSLFGYEVGDPLMDVLYGNNDNIDTSTFDNDFARFVDSRYMPSGFRLKLNLDQAKTIKLTPNPEDGSRFGIVDASNNLDTYNLTLDGNGSRIENVTDLVLNTAGYTAQWFYRADKANWAKVSDLAAGDESPFPKEFDDLLIIGLAIRLDPRNGKGISNNSMMRYAEMLRKFRARYTQVVEKSLDLSLSRLEGQRRQRRGYSLAGEFERGSSYRW